MGSNPNREGFRMSIQPLPSGRLRVQVYDPVTRRNVSVTRLLTREELRELGAEKGTFRRRRDAKAARERARQRLGDRRSGVTVGEFHLRWTTDPLFARPKESTNKHNSERTRAFATRYNDVPIDDIGDEVVAGWLAGGRRNGQVPALRAMWTDACSAKAGRVASKNVWAGLGLAPARGNRDKQPPTQQQMQHMLECARALTTPSFASYLEVACFSGLRPGELDALHWTDILWDDGEISVAMQWNAKLGKFTTPKYGAYITTLTKPARDALIAIKRDSDSPFVFTTLRGHHYTPSTRNHHWNRVRVRAGLEHLSLYMCTRHFYGWYARNVLDMPADVVAAALGHRDGGKLVEELYGHVDQRRLRAKMRNAFEGVAEVVPLRPRETA